MGRPVGSAVPAGSAAHGASAGSAAPRVLFVNPGADVYGSDQVGWQAARALVGDGWAVTAVIGSGGPLEADLRDVGADVRRCPMPVLNKGALSPLGMLRLLLRSVTGLPRLVALIRRHRPDLVYVNTITVPLWFVAARIARVPVVCHVHEAEGNAAPVIARLLYAPLLLCSRLVANSDYTLAVMTRAHRRLTGRTSVIRNPVAAPPSPTAARLRIDGSCRVVYIGRLSPRKGPHVAIDALSALRARGVEATLDLVGAVFPGYEWYERQLRDQAARAGLTDAVTFHGFTRDTAARRAAADVVVVPSVLDESFGNAAVEAALSARPQVVSAAGALPEAVAGFESARIVDPDDAAQLADAVAEVIEHWASYRSRAVADAQLAADRHRVDVYARAVAAVARRTRRVRTDRPADATEVELVAVPPEDLRSAMRSQRSVTEVKR